MTIPFYTDLVDFSVIPNFQGEWDFRTVYIAGSLVSYNGRLYEAQTLVDHSEDALTLLNHDDFHRADTLEGWGTSAEGITWITEYEDDGPGALVISNNEGVSTSSDSFMENITTYRIPSFATINREVLWRFYTPDMNELALYLFFVCGNFESAPSGFVAIQDQGLFKRLILEVDSSEHSIDSVSRTQLPIIAIELNTDYFMLQHTYGNFYAAKLWKASEQEPVDWAVSLSSSSDISANAYLCFDVYSHTNGGSVHVKDVKVYGLPDVSPDQMPSEWLLIG